MPEPLSIEEVHAIFGLRVIEEIRDQLSDEDSIAFYSNGHELVVLNDRDEVVIVYGSKG